MSTASLPLGLVPNDSALAEQRRIVDSFHAAYYDAAWDKESGKVPVGRATWAATRFLNSPVFKNPFDLWTQQEIIAETRPEVVVEAGTCLGGSALFYACLLQTLGLGEVVTIDIRSEVEGCPRPIHPGIHYLTGGSTDPAVVAQVSAFVGDRRAMVVLDSDHSCEHVLAEILAYSPLVPVGGYLVVEDTNVNGHPVFKEHGPGPWEAVEAFLATTDEFEVDESRCRKHLFSHNPRGYLRRVKACVAPRRDLSWLRRTLTGLLERDDSVASFARRENGNLVAGAFGEQPFDEEVRTLGLDWPKNALTMIGLVRLQNVQECVESVVASGVDGDLVECGVWRGGVTIYMRALLQALGDKSRRVWVCDSFQGCPPPSSEHDANGIDFSRPEFVPLSVSCAQVKSNFSKLGLLDDRVVFLEGWFKDTLPRAPIQKISVLRLDGDLYDSTKCALEALYAKVSVGGYVILDDYHTIGQTKRAVDDFRLRNAITDEMQNTSDGNAVFWKKSAA